MALDIYVAANEDKAMYASPEVIAVDTKALEAWAKSQKRITNKAIRGRFDLDEEDADMCYLYLKSEHIVGSMGYVRGI